MIDYEKLKLAHELAEKTGIYFFKITYGMGNKNTNLIELMRFNPDDEHVDSGTFICIDKLIAKLQELTKPEPKFKVGDVWWFLDEANFMWHPKPKSLTITEENKGWYRDDDEWFPSRNALIQSQIDYWQSLKEPDSQRNQVKVDVDSCPHSGFNPVVCHERFGGVPHRFCTDCKDYYPYVPYVQAVDADSC